MPHRRPDSESFMAAGHLYLTNPAHLYDATIAWLKTTGTIPIPGAQGLALQPPTVISIASVFSWLPRPTAVALWTVCDGIAMLAALVVLYRAIRPAGAARPLFWIAAAYFPPLFAEVDAGQFGGFVLLCAVAGVAVGRRRPAWGGVLGGLATALKLYPGAMLLGLGRRRGLRAAPTLVLTAVGAWLAAFAPMGLPDSLGRYVGGVLIPSEGARLQDCAIDSVSTLYSRSIGGNAYAVISNGHIQVIRLPLHAPEAASLLTYATIIALVGLTIWAAWRSGWHPIYGPLLGLSLGALLPSEVYPYQFLPLLPVVLVVVVATVAGGRAWVLAALALGLLLFIKEPCAVAFPNVWTLGGLLLFAVCASQGLLMRERL